MVSPKGTLRQQQTISIAPGPLLSLFLMGWQNPAPQSHLWIQDTEGLVTDTRMHW